MPQFSVVYFDVHARTSGIGADKKQLVKLLSERGIEMEVSGYSADRYAQADVLVAQQAVRRHQLPMSAKVLGQRIYNRHQRQEVLAKLGFPVMPFASPSSDEELNAALDDWDTNFAVAKFDWSFRRAGVFLLERGDGAPAKLPSGFQPGRDTIMKRHVGSPETYKADFFAGHFLGCSVLDTRELDLPDWQIVGAKGQKPADLPGPVKSELCAASDALLRHGIGYVSFDLMREGDDFYIVEVNITNVSRAFWLENLHPYIENFADGIASLIDKQDQIPNYSDIYEQLDAAENDQEAIGLIPEDRKSDFPTETQPREEVENFDAILKRAETYSEQDKSFMTEGPFEVLCGHLSSNVPFYRDSDLSNNDLTKLPIFDLKMVRDNHSELVARPIPLQHGTYQYLTGRLDAERDYAITWTQFGVTVQNALIRKALRWAEIDPASEIIDVTTTIERPDRSIDRLLPINKVITRLSEMTPRVIMLTADVAGEFLRTLRENSQLKTKILGILIDDCILDLEARLSFTEQWSIPIVQVLTNPITGLYAIECPQTGVMHLSTETHIFEVLDEDGRKAGKGEVGELVVTGLYNLAEPITRFKTGRRGQIVSNDDLGPINRTGPIWTATDRQV